MTIRVFASGQSNMKGADPGGPLWSLVSDRVRVWNNRHSDGSLGTHFTTAEDARANYYTFLSSQNNNLGVWFCDRLSRELDEDVDFTMVFRSGTKIENWALGGGPEADVLQKCIDVWATSGQAPADVFIWHQGESDSISATYLSYSTAFLDLVTNLTNAGVLKVGATVIVGGLAEHSGVPSHRVQFNRDILEPLAENNSNIFYAKSDGLEVYDVLTHFTGHSLYAFGHERYFNAYAESQGLSVEDLNVEVNSMGTYNLKALEEIGLNRKNVNNPSDFGGLPSGDGMLSAAMLAAGSVVDFGMNGTNGSYIRFESGLQICWKHATMTRLFRAILEHIWTFDKPFKSVPVVLMVPSLSPNLATEKLYGGTSVAASTTATKTHLRYYNELKFTLGTEVLGAHAIAIGWWK